MNILSNSGVVTRKHTSVQGGSLLKWLTYALHTSRSIPLGDAWELLQMFCFVSFFSRFFSQLVFLKDDRDSQTPR